VGLWNGFFMQVTDVWKKLHHLFDGNNESQPEIELAPLKPDEMAACLLYLLRQSRDCTTQFVIAGTKMVVYLSSPNAVIKNIIEGNITSAIWFNLPTVPPVGVYIDAPNSLSISYIRGTWDAMSILKFFDMLHMLSKLAPNARIKASAYTFTASEIIAFAQIWQEYLPDDV
jgi:hypothetical protein